MQKNLQEGRSEVNKLGEFKRQTNSFTTPFGEGENHLKVEKNRYRIFLSKLCPWCHRQEIVLKMLGLDEVISISRVSNSRQNGSWTFPYYEGKKDPVLGVKSVCELYFNADSSYKKRTTVPAVVDIKSKKVVNNDYFKLTNYWEVEWKEFHKNNAPDLYPEKLRTEIDKLNQIIFDGVNNGVYKCGFARSQEAYEKAYDELFATLDYLEERLEGKKFLFGDELTDSDIRLWVTLVRFDIVYYSLFKTNRNRIYDFKNLWRYTRELYHIPEFKDTTDFEAIKCYHLMSNRLANVIPKGPDMSVWENEK